MAKGQTKYQAVEGLLSYAEKVFGIAPISPGERLDRNPGMGREMLALALERAGESSLSGAELLGLYPRISLAFERYAESNAPRFDEKSPFVLAPYQRLEGAYRKFEGKVSETRAASP